jgi:hypothetical protein
MEPDDEALMASLRELTGSVLDPQLRAHIAEVEREGARVTLYEVRETGAVLMIAHQGERPSMAAIRTAYRRQHTASGRLQ